MKTRKIDSLNVGMPTIMQYNQKDVATGIFKIPVYVPLELYWEHFEVDGQA